MFTEEQQEELGKKLNPDFVSTRDGFSYVQGWQMLDEANRIFGHGMWDLETLSLKCVYEGERETKSGSSPYVTYTGEVKVTVRDEKGDKVSRTGVGFGSAYAKNLGDAHEKSIKEAETDATKRARRSFGYQFGLAVYDKNLTNVGSDEPAVEAEKLDKLIMKAEEKGLLKSQLEEKAKSSWNVKKLEDITLGQCESLDTMIDQYKAEE